MCARRTQSLRDPGGASVLRLQLDRSPRLVRVEKLHLLEFVECLRPEVLFVNDAVLTDDEAPDTRYVIFGRRRDQGEAANHDVLHDKIHRAERRPGTLSLQDLEKIAMIGLRLFRISLFDYSRDIFANRPSPGAVLGRHLQSILLPGSAF